jgi:hypothetical protein
MDELLRIRFKANEIDPRPINWPVKYPFWITGYGDGFSTVISYADSEKYILDNWPEAHDLDVQEVKEIKFSERFEKPSWFKEEVKNE